MNANEEVEFVLTDSPHGPYAAKVVRLGGSRPIPGNMDYNPIPYPPFLPPLGTQVRGVVKWFNGAKRLLRNNWHI